ncbi:hypothetical protein PAXINDRAFT_9506 [Paxillus involutus ATCC 200175]|nr:hypothetical protein PAXINDRAFT_9506 [Paxillus involutus ATCC 200175]
MSDNSDFLSGRNLTRGDYNESVDYDTPGNVRSPAANDSSLSGAHGGSGYGQAGGYNSDRKRQQGKQSVADVDYDTPSNVRSQAGDNSSLSGAHGGSGYGQTGGYSSGQQRQRGQQSAADDDAGYDPGMAGCGSDDTQDCNVPGAGRLGGESRGYERDNDEYDPSSDNFATGTQGGKPSLGDRMKGGVEKMAGKVMRDPHLEVKGEQRKVKCSDRPYTYSS